eukprot:NODE_2851_length_866_cov_238.591862.p3 GENE.NODE_2851_length_866_cov_238.591862~~NODE_2851_length_866_cov_238.591862.p3  ORF type:complete len:170 (+),score=43.59 NODE_2851_length_866_cov_238.591862:3-512(+)
MGQVELKAFQRREARRGGAKRQADLEAGEKGDAAESPQPGSEEGEDDAGDVDVSLDPAIPLDAGCEPIGIVQSYDASKGVGYVTCEGVVEDVSFSREALPHDYQDEAQAAELPDLAGMMVAVKFALCERDGCRTAWEPGSVDLGPPVAERLTLLMSWRPKDASWGPRRS